MVTIQFFGGLKDGDTMALPELRPYVEAHAPRGKPDSVFDRMPEQLRVYGYQQRMAGDQPVQLKNGNYAYDLIESSRKM